MDINQCYLISWGIFLLLAGYFLPCIKSKNTARLISWSIIILTTLFSILITKGQSPLYRMAAIASLQLLAMKSIVMVETYTGKPGINIIQWVVFAQGWFGMRPRPFENLIAKPLNNIRPLLVTGITRILLGIALLFCAFYLRETTTVFFLPELVMLVGLSFILHFGILNISTALWRFLGVDVRELFISPYKSKSLKEFWGKRWNMAFSEMTALIAYKPLKSGYGITAAMLISFFLSGILHEVAISFPVNSGYGLPLLYFVIHGTLMYAESNLAVVRKIIDHKFLCHLWVFFWLIVPMPLLFHPAFTEQVAWPLAETLIEIVTGSFSS